MFFKNILTQKKEKLGSKMGVNLYMGKYRTYKRFSLTITL